MNKKKKKNTIDKSKKAEKRPSLYELARKILLASIGATVIAQEEIETFIEKLVERGELAENDGKKLFDEILEKRKDKIEKAEENILQHVKSVIDKMNIPQKSDLDGLSKKVTELSKQITEMKTNKIEEEKSKPDSP
jgi:poly(hydroxyalkanoate) granule-associated protein